MAPGCCFCGRGNRRKSGNHPPIAEESSIPIEATVNKEQEIKEESAIPIEANISAEKEESDFPIEAAASREKGVRTFSYDELAKAAGYFSIDDNNRLGLGLTGEVFKGELSNGEVVAIKRLKHQANPEHEEMARHQYQVEAEILSHIEPHQNIVKVIGYCNDASNRLLVYEFVPNNSLKSCLHGNEKQTIKWSDRLKIALGIAEGLTYLHEICEPRIIHRDIKSANILLDDKFIPKIGDFGLAKEFMSSHTHVSTAPRGTISYEPPEYYAADLSTKLTEKSDVFSFGVVLLELITGKFAILGGDERLVDWALSPLKQVLETNNKEDLDMKKYNNLVDFKLQKDNDKKEMSRMIYCAAACVYKPMKLRPKMSEIVEVLKGNKEPTDYIWLRNDTQYLYQGSPYPPLPEALRPAVP
uniref:non-specific serine/threonine protein kinase n=1 Tax=Manihot esculenta TaxID=3983 RepID=A0A199UA41_MANES